LKWSTFTVAHSEAQKFINDPIGADNWEITGCRKTPLSLTRLRELWFYGQDLLSKYPTVNPKYRINIESIAPYNSNEKSDSKKYGDLTVMVARIIPFPISIRTNNSPKGFLRVWDGTGNPVTDP
jgi:hypothetical protein